MLARYKLSSCVCPSVCPSVTRQYCTKTAKLKITQMMPYDSPWTLAFWRQNFHFTATKFLAKFQQKYFRKIPLKYLPLRCGFLSKFFDHLLLLGGIAATASDSCLLLQTEDSVVGLSVGQFREPCQTAEPIVMPFVGWLRYVLDGGPDSPRKWQFLVFLANLKARKVADVASSLQNGSFNSLRWVGSCRAGVTLKFSLLNLPLHKR